MLKYILQELQRELPCSFETREIRQSASQSPFFGIQPLDNFLLRAHGSEVKYRIVHDVVMHDYCIRLYLYCS